MGTNNSSYVGTLTHAQTQCIYIYIYGSTSERKSESLRWSGRDTCQIRLTRSMGRVRFHLAVVKIREKERENTRNFDVNNNNNKRSNSLDEWKIYRARRNRGIFNRVGSLETNVQSSVRDSRSVSSAAALDALHFQMQIHERCDGHERGQVYSSDMIYSSRVDVW